MEYNYLGSTGLKLSEIGLGSMNFGRIGKENAFALLDKARELGINFIDSANAYGPAEDILGEWMHTTDCRDEMIINTKVGWPMGKGPNQRGLSRRHITQQLDQTKQRLQTDWIDIYQPHYYDGVEDLNQLVMLFHEFVEQQDITVIGAPLFIRPYQLVSWYYLAKEQGLHSIRSKLMTTSLLSRGMYDGNTRQIAKDYDLGLITFGALGGGLLTGKYHSSRPYPETGKEMFRETVEQGKIDGLIDRLEELSTEEDTSMAKLCFAWVLSHDFMDTVVIGASNTDQLEDIITAKELKLDKSTLDQMTELSDQYKLW